MLGYSWLFNGTYGAIERDLEAVKYVLCENKTTKTVSHIFGTTEKNILGAIARYKNGELNKGIDDFNKKNNCNIKKVEVE